MNLEPFLRPAACFIGLPLVVAKRSGPLQTVPRGRCVAAPQRRYLDLARSLKIRPSHGSPADPQVGLTESSNENHFGQAKTRTVLFPPQS